MKIFRKIKSAIVYFFSFVFRIFKIKKNRIYFVSNFGKTYACNPRAIFEYLYKNHRDEFDFCYIINDEKNRELLPKDVKTAKFGSIKDMFYFSTSKYIINNFRFNARKYRKRKNQVYVQTWHGSTIPYKKIEKDAINLDKKYTKNAIRDSKNIDYLSVGSKSCYDIFKNCFYCPDKIVLGGNARSDRLINVDPLEVEKIRMKLNINKDDYVVLFAPTFRDNEPIEMSFLNNEKIIEAFKSYSHKEGKENVKLLYRFHPNLMEKVKDLELKNAINVTEYFDIQDLILISDILITDFSSCMSDMMVAKKMSIIYNRDAKKYLNEERGLYIKPSELPFPIANSEDELLDIINNLDKVKKSFEVDVKAFEEKIGMFEDGRSSERTYEFLRSKK